jgi:hypothetical protein
MRLSVTQPYPVKENLHAVGFLYKTGLLTTMLKRTAARHPTLSSPSSEILRLKSAI